MGCGSALLEDRAAVTSAEISAVVMVGLSHLISSYHDGYSIFIFIAFEHGNTF